MEGLKLSEVALEVSEDWRESLKCVLTASVTQFKFLILCVLWSVLRVAWLLKDRLSVFFIFFWMTEKRHFSFEASGVHWGGLQFVEVAGKDFFFLQNMFF